MRSACIVSEGNAITHVIAFYDVNYIKT